MFSFFSIPFLQEQAANIKDKKIKELIENEIKYEARAYDFCLDIKERLKAQIYYDSFEKDDGKFDPRNMLNDTFTLLITSLAKSRYLTSSDMSFIGQIIKHLKAIKRNKNIDEFVSGLVQNLDKFFEEHPQKYAFFNLIPLVPQIYLDPSRIKYFVDNCFLADDFLNINFFYKIRFLVMKYLSNNGFEEKFISVVPPKNLIDLLINDFEIVLLYIRAGSNFSVEKPKLLQNEVDGRIYIDFLLFSFYTRFILICSLFFFSTSRVISHNHTRLDIYIFYLLLQVDMLIFKNFYEFIDIPSWIYLSYIRIVDSIMLALKSNFQDERYDNLRSILPKIYRAKKVDEYDEIIEEIVKIAYGMWKDKDCKRDHYNMLLFFKNSKKYGKFFEVKDFDKRLKEALKICCLENQFDRVKGTEYNQPKLDLKQCKKCMEDLNKKRPE